MIVKLLVLAVTVCGGLTLAWPMIWIQERSRRGTW